MNYDEISAQIKIIQNNWFLIFPCHDHEKIKEKLGTIPLNETKMTYQIDAYI